MLTRRGFLCAIAVAAGSLAAGSASAATPVGADVFRSAGCGSCHTLAAAGTSGTAGPNLDQLRPTAATVAAQVRSGGGGMPSFASTLSPAQIDAVAAYVASSAAAPAAAAPSALPAANTSVLALQHELARLGFFSGPFTGVYGPLTTAAVRAFQRSAGLPADGRIGPATRAALTQRSAHATLTTPVTTLQRELAQLGFFHGPITGFYGPLTTAAVKAFQHSARLAADGRFGPATARALTRRLTRGR